MNKLLLTCIALLGLLSVAAAATVATEENPPEPAHCYGTIADRDLVGKGSFEGGNAIGAPVRNCSTGIDCDGITDPSGDSGMGSLRFDHDLPSASSKDFLDSAGHSDFTDTKRANFSSVKALY
jgi:hypothetical protein